MNVEMTDLAIFCQVAQRAEQYTKGAFEHWCRTCLTYTMEAAVVAVLSAQDVGGVKIAGHDVMMSTFDTQQRRAAFRWLSPSRIPVQPVLNLDYRWLWKTLRTLN